MFFDTVDNPWSLGHPESPARAAQEDIWDRLIECLENFHPEEETLSEPNRALVSNGD